MRRQRLNLLGGFELRAPGGEPITLATKKARALLAFLALTAGQPHARDKLATLLWAESGDVQARTSLRQALATLRKALSSEDGVAFVGEADSVAFVPDALEVDVVDFERLLDQGSAEARAEAVALYHGELLEGFDVDAPAFDEWLLTERQRLRERALEAMGELLTHDVESGNTERGLRVGHRLLALDPLREDVHRTLMRLYAKQSRPTLALRQYRACRATLERELGVQPEPETEQLYKDILQRRRRGAAAPADKRAPPEPAQPTRGREAEGERAPELRQVTILFADLTGYTELSGELDPEDLHALTDRFFTTVDGLIESFGGEVAKHIGDGVMAIFGARAAHSNDPERAVRSALAVHQAMHELHDPFGRPLSVHIGIASGQVLITEAARQSTVTGQSVNLASRLTDAAGPGETLISDHVHTAIAERSDADAVGDVDVKGLRAPVKVWRLHGLRDAGAAPHPFVGRNAELQQLCGLLGACRASGRGFAVYVRGEAGIGKTTLVQQFQNLATIEGFACHTALIFDFGVGRGQDAIRSITRKLVGFEGNAGPQSEPGDLVAKGLVSAERQVFLADLLDLSQPTETRRLYEAMDSRTRARGIRETIVELVKGCASREPLVLTIEDLHWADRDTLDHLHAIVSAVTECPAILAMTARSEADPLDRAWRAAAGAPLITVDLQPLPRDEAIELAGLYADAESPFALHCVERSGGNPLFLEQLLRSAETSGEKVPGSVQSVVLARMDALAPGDRHALQAASVMGQRLSLTALRYLIGDPAYDCERLVREVLVRPDGDDDYLFAHALVQEAVYGSLLKSRRQELHARAAEWFADSDPVLYAEHLDGANDPNAAEAYLRASRGEASAHRYDRALRLAERGLELSGEQAISYALTSLRGDLLRKTGAVEASLAAFEVARNLAADAREQALAWLGLAEGMRIVDRYDDALDALANAERAVRELPDAAAQRAPIHELRGNIYFPLGEIDRCLQEHEQALAAARKVGSAELEARALGGLADAYYAGGRLRTAYDSFQRCIELCHAHDLEGIEIASLYMIAMIRAFLNDLRGAFDDADRAAETARRVGHMRAELLARQIAGWLLLELGDTRASRQQVEASRALVRRLGAFRFEPENLVYIAKLDHAEGDRNGAIERLNEALAIVRDSGAEKFFGPAVLGAFARLADDPQARDRALEEGEQILHGGAVSHNYLFFYRDAMETALTTEEWDQAERYAAALEDYTRAEPLPWADFHAARARALAAHGRGARDQATMDTLCRLRDEARRIGLRVALPAIDEALATSEAR